MPVLLIEDASGKSKMNPKAVLFILLACSGCASITGSKNQPVSVQASHNGQVLDGADCTLVNDKGTWFVKSPGSAVVQKSGQDLVVTCNKSGIPQGVATYASSANGGVWGNILFGGLIGFAVDASSGAAFDYPTSMGVQMGQVIRLEPSNVEKNTQTMDEYDPRNSIPLIQAGTRTSGVNVPQANVSGKSQVSQPQNSGIVFSSAGSSNPGTQKLREIKALRDEGILTQKEYDTKKTEILKGM